MKLGLVIPQGWIGEYRGWSPEAAWSRSLAVASEAEDAGFESVWVFDHLATFPVPSLDILFESWVLLTAIGQRTAKVRLGHLVCCAAFRNAALTAKMASTLSVATQGRFDLGLGAGWNRDEFLAFGYPFPTAHERLAGLGDALEVVAQMMSDRSANFTGSHHSVHGAANEPKTGGPGPIPIIVGGNGPEVTWRLAARYADELNVDDMDPDVLAQALPIIANRCEEIGRDPRSLAVSVHYFWPKGAVAGPVRIRTLQAYLELGIHRLMVLLPAAVDSHQAIESFVSDAIAAGVDIGGAR